MNPKGLVSKNGLSAPAARARAPPLLFAQQNTLNFPMALKIGSERSGVGVNLLL